MSEASKPTSKPPFRNLRVEPFEPKEFLPGLSDNDLAVDVSVFTPHRYVVTFEYRTGWRRKWRKVKAYA